MRRGIVAVEKPVPCTSSLNNFQDQIRAFSAAETLVWSQPLWDKTPEEAYDALNERFLQQSRPLARLGSALSISECSHVVGFRSNGAEFKFSLMDVLCSLRSVRILNDTSYSF